MLYAIHSSSLCIHKACIIKSAAHSKQQSDFRSETITLLCFVYSQSHKETSWRFVHNYCRLYVLFITFISEHHRLLWLHHQIIPSDNNRNNKYEWKNLETHNCQLYVKPQNGIIMMETARFDRENESRIEVLHEPSNDINRC